VRFFGRRRFVSSIFVLLSALRVSIGERHCHWLQRRLRVPVSLSTWQRWRRFWQRRFVHSAFWQQARASVTVPSGAVLPRALLAAFAAPVLWQRLVLLLRFVSPLSCAVI
jgi:hypothetical protein